MALGFYSSLKVPSRVTIFQSQSPKTWVYILVPYYLALRLYSSPTVSNIGVILQSHKYMHWGYISPKDPSLGDVFSPKVPRLGAMFQPHSYIP